ncbi:MAG: hypothetical protein ACE5HT_08920 [Gemmatimonadales bacterium]
MNIFTLIAIMVIGVPLCRALAVRISRGAGGNSPATRRALEQIEQRLAETEDRLADTANRLAELEERLDFTERMLTQQKSRPQLNA